LRRGRRHTGRNMETNGEQQLGEKRSELRKDEVERKEKKGRKRYFTEKSRRAYKDPGAELDEPH